MRCGMQMGDAFYAESDEGGCVVVTEQEKKQDMQRRYRREMEATSGTRRGEMRMRLHCALQCYECNASNAMRCWSGTTGSFEERPRRSKTGLLLMMECEDKGSGGRTWEGLL